jgi:uncharacterized SAM-binding protein YcdF (DUF218 family)
MEKIRSTGTRLLLSGGKIFAPDSDAELMARLAVELGVDPADVVLENDSRNTKDEAKLIKDMVGQDRFILVTLAYHMPRSMAFFNAQGMQPISERVGHLALAGMHFKLKEFFPSSDRIYASELVPHEILGMLSASIMGQL